MTSTHTLPHAVSGHHASELRQVGRFADLIMFCALVGQAAVALAVASMYGGIELAAGGAVALLALGALAFKAAPGSLTSQIVLTSCNALAVMLQIQLGRGLPELHFGVFVLLGLTLVYRDWRALVVVAGLFAVHHLAFDRMQALGIGVYCISQPDLARTLMHAAYVVVQTSVEIVLAVKLREAAIESVELHSLIECIDQDGMLCLDVSTVPASAPNAAMLKSAVLRMETAMSDVQQAASLIEQASVEVATGNMDLSQRTESQASNLQQTAASMEQLSGAVRNTAEAAVQAKTSAGSASEAAAAGGQAIERVVQVMARMSDASRQIADITGVMDGIAFQTNILALNAAVEAARAGEQGKGFAVVAMEVRSLAMRAASAAKEIKVLVQNNMETAQTGSHMVNDTRTSIQRIVEEARRVDQLIAEISAATGEQTAGISQIGGSVTDLDNVTQQNAALVEQSAAASESLKGQALRLNEVVRMFVLAPSVRVPAAA